MRKFLAGSLMLLVIGVTAAITANAQSYCPPRGYRSNNYGYNNYYNAGYNNRRYNNQRRYNRGYERGYSRGYNNRGYQNAYYSTPTYRTRGYSYDRGYSNNRGYNSYGRPSYYRRHRNAINIAAGTGVGALIGGLAGGRRGAVIGALIGGGGSAVYSYGVNPKKRRYYRQYR